MPPSPHMESSGRTPTTASFNRPLSPRSRWLMSGLFAATAVAIVLSPRNAAPLVALLAACVWVVMIAVFRARSARAQSRQTALVLALCGLPVALLGASSALAVNPRVALLGAVGQHVGVATWLTALLLLVVTALVARPTDLGDVARAGAGFGMFVSIAAVLGPSPDDDTTYPSATHVPEGDEAVSDRTELTGGSSEAAESSPESARRGPSRVGAMLGGLAVPVLIALAVIAGYVVTGTQVYCAESCHADQVSVVAAVDAEHATCVGCHEATGVLGAPANIVSRGRMAVSWIRGEDAPDTAVVDSESCLGCHEEVLQRTITISRIRMSHREPVESGLTCVQCHPDTGHTVDTRYAMSSCLPCHDGEKATTECETCHIVDPYSTFSDPNAESAVPLDRAVYPLVRFDDVGCGGVSRGGARVRYVSRPTHAAQRRVHRWSARQGRGVRAKGALLPVSSGGLVQHRVSHRVPGSCRQLEA